MALNTVAVVGRLGDRPELRYTQNGKAVLNFNLAVDRPKRQGANQETDWISCVAWEKLAEIINEYCDKGKQMAVSGRLQSRT